MPDDVQDVNAPKPLLAGLKVLDLSHFLAGPYATMILADLGAEVIKVEPPTGDPIRKVPPFIREGMGSMYFSTNRNKEGIVLDLKTSEGREELYHLAEAADVLCNNFRTSVLERLGIDYPTMHRINERLVYCSICGFDSVEPLASLPTTDSLVQAVAGVMSITGDTDGPPARVGYQIGDTAAGLWAAIAILAGVSSRAQDGIGRYVEISLLDAQLSLLIWQAQDYLSKGIVYGRMGTSLANLPPSKAYRCGDDRYVYATPSAIPAWWEGYCRAVGHAELAHDPKFEKIDARQQNRAELETMLTETFATEPSDHWIAAFEREGVPVARVQNIAEAFAFPSVERRNMIVDVDMRDGTSERMVGNPIKTGTPEQFTGPPTIGQDTDNVLGALRQPALAPGTSHR